MAEVGGWPLPLFPKGNRRPLSRCSPGVHRENAVVKALKGGTWRLFFILIKPIQVFLGESLPPIIMAGDLGRVCRKVSLATK